MTTDTTSNHIRALIARAEISQREVARRMQINDRTVRRYCKYGGTVQFVLALEWIAARCDWHRSREFGGKISLLTRRNTK